MRLVRLGLLVCGAALFVWLLATIGPGAVVQAFADLSWRLLIILVFPFGLTTLLDTLGWSYAFRRDTVPFGALLASLVLSLVGMIWKSATKKRDA
jgi:hypothetical protein